MIPTLPNIDPYFHHNFELSQRVPPFFNHTRATNAAAMNVLGKIASIAPNVPRIEYLKGSCEGMLLENAATYIERFSNDLSSVNFIKENLTLAEVTDATAPVGRVWRLTTSNTEQSRINGASLTAPNQDYAFSCYVKAGTAKSCMISFANKASQAFYSPAILNMETGVLENYSDYTGASPTVGAIDVGNGWWYIWVVTRTAGTITTIPSARIIPAASGNTESVTPPPSGSTMFICGWNVVRGRAPVSYYSVQDTEFTRAADTPLVVKGFSFDEITFAVRMRTSRIKGHNVGLVSGTTSVLGVVNQPNGGDSGMYVNLYHPTNTGCGTLYPVECMDTHTIVVSASIPDKRIIVTNRNGSDTLTYTFDPAKFNKVVFGTNNEGLAVSCPTLLKEIVIFDKAFTAQESQALFDLMDHK